MLLICHVSPHLLILCSRRRQLFERGVLFDGNSVRRVRGILGQTEEVAIRKTTRIAYEKYKFRHTSMLRVKSHLLIKSYDTIPFRNPDCSAGVGLANQPLTGALKQSAM